MVFISHCCFYFKWCFLWFIFSRPSETSHWFFSELPTVGPLLLPLLLGWFPINIELPSYHITSSIWPDVVRVCAWFLRHFISTAALLSKTLFSLSECVTSWVEEAGNWSTRHSGNIHLSNIYWVFILEFKFSTVVQRICVVNRTLLYYVCVCVIVKYLWILIGLTLTEIWKTNLKPRD